MKKILFTMKTILTLSFCMISISVMDAQNPEWITYTNDNCAYATVIEGDTVWVATTGGLANPAFSLLETLGAAGLSIFAILLPVVALILIAGLFFFVLSRLLRRRRVKG